MEKQNTLLKDAEKNTVYHILIIAFLSTGLVSLPIKKLFDLFISDYTLSSFLSGILLRFVLFFAFLILFKKYEFNKVCFCKFNKSGIICLLISLVVCVNNFPFVSLLKGELVINFNTLNVCLFLLYCLSIALFEEMVFRGIIFPLFLIAFKDKNKKELLSVIASSFVFGIMHVFNIFNGENIASVLLQIGYTFLMGGVFCVCMISTKNIIIPMFLHFVYDIGGLFCSRDFGIASGHTVDMLSVVITVVLSLVLAAYILLYFIKKYNNKGE